MAERPYSVARRIPRAWAVLALLVGASAVIRFWAGTKITGLWIAPDEMIYASLGQSLWSSGELRIFGGPPGVYSFVYPALVGLPLSLDDLGRGYTILKGLQAVVVSLTAVPVFLWGRRLAGEWWALVAATLTLALPALLYSGMIMTEVAFLPALVLAAWALAAVLERPTLGRQALLVGAVLLACATRLQALALVPAAVTAVGIDALLARDLRRVLRFWPAAAAVAALAAVWAAWRVAVSGWTGILGSYAAAAESDYTLDAASRFVAHHAADLVLLTALFPLPALLLLAWDTAAGGAPPAVRAFVATTLAVTVWLVVEVGVFASENVGRLAERDLIGLAPLLFLGLVTWLARGAPRSWLRASLAALLTLALLLTLPLDDYVVQEAVPDAFSLVPLLWLKEHTSAETLELAVWVGAAAAVALLALLPRRALVVLPAFALLGLSTASVAATREVSDNAAWDQRYLLGGERGWIDRAADGPVAYLYAGENYWNGVWQQLFWNRKLDQVYVLDGIRIPPGLPQTTVHVDDSGRLLLPDGSPASERLVVSSNALTLAGEAVAGIEQQFIAEDGLTLWRLAPPPRLFSVTTGVRENGDMHEPGRMRVYDCQDGRLELTLLPKVSTIVILRVNGRDVQTLDVAGEEFVNATVFPPAGANICHFEVIGDSLLGSTRFEFVRS
jgi:hypothetical protein